MIDTSYQSVAKYVVFYNHFQLIENLVKARAINFDFEIFFPYFSIYRNFIKQISAINHLDEN